MFKYNKIFLNFKKTLINILFQRSVLIVQSALKKWDRGTKSQRKEILQKFIDDNFGKTGPEIEDGFCQSASLFLTRVLSWLRMTYITGTCVSLQLKALQVFVTATAGFVFYFYHEFSYITFVVFRVFFNTSCKGCFCNSFSLDKIIFVSNCYTVFCTLFEK